MTDQSFSQRPRRVLFASASVGAGHNQAAAALAAALRRACPDVQAEFVDVVKFTPWWFRAYYVGGYTALVTRLRWLYALGYRLTNRPQTPRRTLAEHQRLLLERRALRGFVRHLLDCRPVLVVATHYLAMPAIGRLIGGGADGLEMLAVVTDRHAHRFWYAENVSRYFVADERMIDQLRPWGVPPERIVPSGIPVHPKWTDPQDRQAVLTRWRLPAHAPIVLISGGTYFTVGPVQRIARGVLAATDAHVVVLTGSNKKLQAGLSRMPEAPQRLTAVPMTDAVHELAEVASLIVTKAGGMITAECLAKGLPMVLTKSLPGQEAANARLLIAAGAAVPATGADRVVRQVRRLLTNSAEAHSLAAAARGLHRPAADTIVAAIREVLGR